MHVEILSTDIHIRWAEHVALMVEKRGVYRDWGGGELEGQRPLGRHRRSWEDNIKMDI